MDVACDHVWHLVEDWTGSRGAQLEGDAAMNTPFDQWPQESVRVSKFNCVKCREIVEDRTVLGTFVPVSPAKKRRGWKW